MPTTRIKVRDHAAALFIWVVFVIVWLIACPLCIEYVSGAENATLTPWAVIQGYWQSPRQMLTLYPLCLLMFILNLGPFVFPSGNSFALTCVLGLFLISPFVLLAYTGRLAVRLSDLSARVIPLRENDRS